MLKLELYVEVTGEGRPEDVALMALYSSCEQVPRAEEKIILVESAAKAPGRRSRRG